ncbi:MAG: FkbM family methyltransferase [Thermodesulfobacteriota bacterium]|nr:FkbM family methyltransferase [Thermodesulfobacteriota bacterium]
MLSKRYLIPYLLRWITKNISIVWGMRIIRRIPGFLTDFETKILYKDTKFCIFTGETIGSRLFYCGEYEPVQMNIFLSLISKGDLIFDVGANIGLFSLLAAKQSIQVVAFEPSVKIWSQLKTNIQINEMEDNIIAVNKAVSNESSTVLFFESRHGNQGVGRIFSFGDSKNISETYRISADTLDHFAYKYGIPQLIKIDIEGAEWLALKGARRIMRLKEAPKFFIEFHPQEIEYIDGSIEECIQLFLENGYFSYQLLDITNYYDHRWYVFSKEKIDDFPETKTK